MEDESQQPVIQMMDSWVQQPGYPVLRAEVQRGDQAQVRLTQQRFLYTGLKKDDASVAGARGPCQRWWRAYGPRGHGRPHERVAHDRARSG